MSFEFFSAGNVMLEVTPFPTITKEGETEQAAYDKKKTRVMEWLVGLTNRQTMGDHYHPTMNAFPDMVDMAIIKTTNPERWEQLELDAISDLALNGFNSPAPEFTLAPSPVDTTADIPAPRSANETLAPTRQQAA